MKYVGSAILIVWLAGLYLLAGRARDDIRRALDNPAPDARPSDFRFLGFRKLACNIDPTRLTEVGHAHLKKAIRSETIMFVWMIDVFIWVVLSLLATLP
jgi:hypothetical protein